MIRKLLFSLVIFIFLCSSAWATDRWVRPVDGGTGTQCLGTSDNPYDGSGTGEACAVNSLQWLIPPRGESTTRAAAAGDTIYIATGSSNQIGCRGSASDCRDPSVNLINQGNCDASWSYDCYMRPIPDNITIKGCGPSGCASRADFPEIWGSGRVLRILDATNSTGVTLEDIEITDHSSTGFNHPSLSAGCNSGTKPDNLTAQDGLWMDNASDLTLNDVYIHGVCRYNIFGGRYGDLEFNDTRINHGGYGGWNSDTTGSCTTCGADSSATTIDFNGTCSVDPFVCTSQVNYNGCIENWQSDGTVMTSGCYSQGTGGYGDGIGSNSTTGQWTFNGTDISHNSSDGLDLLYLNRGTPSGGTLKFYNGRAEGNNGNQIKGPNQMDIQSSDIIGNCGYFCSNNGIATSGMTKCRASGNTIEIAFVDDNTSPKIIGNNISGNGDVVIDTQQDSSCASGTDIIVRNNYIIGGAQATQDSSWTCASSSPAGGNIAMFYNSNSGSCNADFAENYNIFVGSFQSNQSTGANSTTATATHEFTGTIKQGPGAATAYYQGASYADEFIVKAAATGINFADESVSGAITTDLQLFARGASWDAGSLEYQSAGSTCGNNSKEGSEVCDGTDLNSQTCITQGFDSGTLSCHANCGSFVTTSCVTDLCGNGNINPDEDCDGVNLNSQTCSSQGFSGGTLACSSCAFNTSGCVAIACQNGYLDAGEQCDDGNSTQGDGCSSICETETTGIEKFLTYTETDPGSNLSVHTHYVDIGGITHTTDTRLYYDFGASYFTDFVHRIKVQIDLCEDNGAGEDGGLALWSMSSTLRASLFAQEAAGDGFSFSIACLSSSARYIWKLVETEGTDTVDTFQDTIPTITRYVEIQRLGTTLTAKIYSDVNFTTLLDTLTVTVPTTAYRYLYAGFGYNDGVEGTLFSGEISNFNLNVEAPPPPEDSDIGIGMGPGCAISSGASYNGN